MDDIPGLIDFTLQSFTFKQFFKKQAAANRDQAVAKLRKKNKKLRKGNIVTLFSIAEVKHNKPQEVTMMSNYFPGQEC